MTGGYPTARKDSQPAVRFSSQDKQLAGQELWVDWHRKPECARHGQKPQAGEGDFGCELG